MLKIEDTALVLVDVQGKLANIMHDSPELLTNIEKLIQGAKILGVPVIWLEQYPKGLGPTAEVLSRHLTEEEPIAKMSFSGFGHDDFLTKLRELGRSKILIAGIESHICVYQTAKDLLASGREVEVVIDCVSARTKRDSELGVRKMVSLGAAETSVEMALFELMGTAKHPQFKEISNLIK